MESLSQERAPSLAVLPFENLSGKEEYLYFSKGLLEELIVDLSHFSALQIISSYTSSRLTDPGLDEVEAARKIDVDYLLKGSLHLQPHSIRLNTQLLNTVNRQIIWAERFDAPMDSLFELQENLVNRIVFSISSEVNNNLLTAARDKPVTSLAAYDCWLRGMDHLRQGTLEADSKAREFFNQALSLDPNYAKAYAGLSLSHFNEWSCQLWKLWEVSEQSAYTYASRACQLDESDHLVQMILGRVYLYRRQFDEAEHHLNRSLELNGNDADNLVQIATCMTFLGKGEKAKILFNKALRLNPYRNLWYYQYGSVVYFALREFDTAAKMALKRQLVNIWVDLPGYIAASYAHLGERKQARKYIALFVDSYIASITGGVPPQTEEVLDWIRGANPFKHKEDMDCITEGLILAGISEELAENQERPRQPEIVDSKAAPAIFKQEQAIWHMVFDGEEITMPDLKGFHDIAKLLASPESELHCTELMGNCSSMDERDFTLDEKARQEYLTHTRELRHEIEEAETHNDRSRKEKLQEELEYLLEHLSKNLGLAKQSRKMNSPAERARAAVTLRIRSSVKKIGPHHPALAKHLTNSLRTGQFCSYSPEDRREWILN